MFCKNNLKTDFFFWQIVSMQAISQKEGWNKDYNGYSYFFASLV